MAIIKIALIITFFRIEQMKNTTVFIYTILAASFSHCTETGWDQLIVGKKDAISEKTYTLITKQYEAVILGSAPKVVDACIKSIPILEAGELLVDVNTMQNKRITMLPNPYSAFASPDCNSGLPSASKIRKTVFEKLEQMLLELDRLAPFFGYESGQIDIKVFEGLRDIATQEMLFNNKVQEIKSANAQLTNEEVFAEACKWVSPVVNNVPVHSTGAAIDIRLWDTQKGEFIDLGKFGVVWGKNLHAPTFSSEVSLSQKNNRLLMICAATQAGLINYCYEFWHYSSGDRYASYWTKPEQERIAIYGSV